MADSLLKAPPPVRASSLETASSRAPLVLAVGTLTTALALVAVYLLAQAGTNVMGWYADYILPVGAILVGLVGSSGFALASWKSHCKVTGTLIAEIALVLLGGYIAAEYIAYGLVMKKMGIEAPIGFFRYFDLVTRTIAFEDHGKPGSPLGMLGYGIRTLE